MIKSERHQYAFDANGIRVHARDGLKGVPYYCDCPERHPLKLVPPSGLGGKRSFSDYFAHYGGSSCMSGGESMKHKLAKHKLCELAANLSFALERCKHCGWTRYFKSDGHTVQIEVQSTDKCLRYDGLLHDKHGTPVIALEVRHTHASSRDKIDSTRSSLGFAEFMVDDVLSSTDGRLHNVEAVLHPVCDNCRDFAAALEKRRLERAAARLNAAAELKRERDRIELRIKRERDRIALKAEEAAWRIQHEKGRLAWEAEEKAWLQTCRRSHRAWEIGELRRAGLSTAEILCRLKRSRKTKKNPIT